VAITVKFIGICTHFNREEWPQDEGEWPLGEIPHRVLLPQKRSDEWFDDIPHHFPRLTIAQADLDGDPPRIPALLTLEPDEPVYTWSINRAAFRLAGSGTPLRADSWRKLPRLRTPQRPVVADPDVMLGQRVHALFDVYAGALSTECYGQATAAYLEVELPSPQLIVAPIDAPGRGVPIPLKNNATVTITHMSDDRPPHDKPHFALHLGVAKALLGHPKDWSYSVDCHGGKPDDDDGPPVGLGPDCSNSGYP